MHLMLRHEERNLVLGIVISWKNKLSHGSISGREERFHLIELLP